MYGGFWVIRNCLFYMVANIDYLENPFVLFDGDIVPHIGHLSIKGEKYFGLELRINRKSACNYC